MGEWISVKDRLPEKIGEYLVVYESCYVRESSYIRISLFYEGHFNFKFGTVTHWMPLPEPPKEE